MDCGKMSIIFGSNESVECNYGENMNTLVVAPPGGGKTFSIVSPNIINNNGCSMFIDDKKGNLYHTHSKRLKKEGYKVYCFNLINFKGNIHYNPFSLLRTRNDIHKIVNFLIPDEKTGKDPYWIDSARELAECLIEILMHDNKPVTFESFISLLHMTGTDEVDDLCDFGEWSNEYVFKVIAKQKNRGEDYAGMERYKSIRKNAKDTWRSIRSSCISAVAAFDSDELFTVTDKTTIDFTRMADEKVAIFVTSSDINNTYAPLVKFMYRDILEKLIHYADNMCIDNNSMLPQHVRFILDDFASGTIMEGFENIIANCRSRNISFLICIQSLTQLRGLYGSMVDSILDCINYKVYFSSSNLNTQRYLSEIMNIPLLDIQKMGKEDLCLEKINCCPKFIKRLTCDEIVNLLNKNSVKAANKKDCYK